jgi:hypothetical protein
MRGSDEWSKKKAKCVKERSRRLQTGGCETDDEMDGWEGTSVSVWGNKMFARAAMVWMWQAGMLMHSSGGGWKMANSVGDSGEL